MREGWTEITIESVLNFTIGGIWGAEPDREEANVKVVRSTEFRSDGVLFYDSAVDRSIKKSQLTNRRLTPGDILLEKSGGGPSQPVGRVVFVEEDIPNNTVCSNFVQLVRPDASKIVSRFLFLILWQWHFQNRTLEFQAQTTGIRNLRTPDYLAQEIYLPPLHEQERIVDLISSVDSYIEALEQQAESARKSRSAVLHEMLSAGGEGWTETTLGEVAECSWGNTETTKSKYVDAGYLAYSASGADGFLDWFEHDRTAVVLSAIGAQCGKTWFADGKWTSIKNTIWLKSDNLNLLDKYLFYLSNGEQFWQIRGQAQPFISLGDVKKTKVNLPPLPEQKRIVDLISSMDNGISATEKLISDTKQLRSGLLSDLLSGEHEIPQSYDKVMGAA